MIAFVSKSEADCRILREVAGRVSQSVVGFPDAQQARKAIHRLDPEIIIYDMQVAESGNWQALLEDAQAAQSLLLVVSRNADERLWAEVLNLGGFDVLTLPFERDELRWALSSALRHGRGAPLAAMAG